MIVGILGAPLNNINMGCVALSYSLLAMLEEICTEKHCNFEYIVFDYKYDAKKYDVAAKTLNIDRNKISFGGCGNISDPLRTTKHLPGIVRMIPNIKKCDLLIDMTEGDSFSDIYGDAIFKGKTNVKILVERMGKPLVIGPQTIGPFLKEKNERKALNAVKNASLVFTRDEISANLVREWGIEAVPTIDLAFALPYHRICKDKTNKIKVGINVSSMLYFPENEMKVQRFKLKADYKRCIERFIEILSADERYQVYLIPHVELDDRANEDIERRFENVTRVEFVSNPVEIKSIISSMDFFCGSRMHATIAAFSTGVPCVPMSYSRKFTGLYNSIGYNHIIDLEASDTSEALNKLFDCLDNYSMLRAEECECNKRVSLKMNTTKEYLKSEIIKFYIQ